jgi:hypothetical protein
VSHQPERKEKNCLNCGTLVAGRFCQTCGQENMETRQSFWGLTRHFIYDVFHFDGKFFDTLKYLLFRPGFVPKEYVRGKRVSYLDPIRMYLFTSAVFFLIFFSVANPKKGLESDNNRNMTQQERFALATSLYQKRAGGDSDTQVQQQLFLLMDTGRQIVLKKPDGRPPTDSSFPVTLSNTDYLAVARPEDHRVPISSGAGWLSRKINQRVNDYKEKHGDDTAGMIGDLLESFLHKLPYVLFVSLPFFALLLQLLYVRRKNFYYSDHAVFTLYHYIFSFMLLLIKSGVDRVSKYLKWDIWSIVNFLLFLAGGVYLFIAMKRFYGQGFGKTMGKFLLLNFLGFIVMVILFAIFLFLSIFQL